MKLSLLKTITGLLVLFACFAPLCSAQTAEANQPARQNGEASGEYENLPFMQTEQAARNETGSGGLLLKTLGAMFLIVGLIFVGAWGMKKLGFGNFKANSAEDAPDLTILSSVSLGSGRTISTVRFGERTLLIGSTAQSFTLLADDAENDAETKTKPRSVAEMLARESDSFSAELARAEYNLDEWETKGEKIS